MLPFIEKIIKGSKVAGVEVIFNENGYSFNVAVITRKNNAIIVDSYSSNINTVEEAKKIISGLPVALVLNGKGLIHRKIQHDENDTINSLLSKVLPNAKPEDFYTNTNKVNDNESFLSIVRKDQTDTLIKLLNNSGIDTVQNSLGPYILNSVLSFLKVKPNDEIGEYEIATEAGKISSFTKIELHNIRSVKIGEQEIDGSCTIAYAAALTYLTGNSNTDEAVKEPAEEYRQKRIFKIGGYSILIFFFLLLQVNSLLLNHYKDISEELDAEVLLNKGEIERYNRLKNEYQEKRLFFEESGLLDNINTSFCADQIAQNIPQTIRLTSLNINPAIKKQVNLEDELSFKTKNISITGLTSKSTDLNEWIKTLGGLQWISRVTLLDYKQDKQKKEAEFSLGIVVK